MTIRQLIAKIRLVVSDETKHVWDDDTDMLAAINEARHHLWGKRPEAFFTSKILVEMPEDISSATSGSIDTLDRYAESIVSYAAHTLLMEQRRDGDREKAAEQLTIFKRTLGR